ncbi:hypothetical protein FVER14953_21422 [Fusarium verticillioides]|nr:hypothetical protein FVER14953_21422 [Fusarium verticillioides]
MQTDEGRVLREMNKDEVTPFCELGNSKPNWSPLVSDRGPKES